MATPFNKINFNINTHWVIFLMEGAPTGAFFLDASCNFGYNEVTCGFLFLGARGENTREEKKGL